MSELITAVVSGSFQFKPEIDQAIEALEQTGITVLEPSKGWLILPRLEIVERLEQGLIRPLPSEENLTTRQIEDRFLRSLGSAHLIYLMNKDGYVGNSASLELGYALNIQKPTYALEPLNFAAMEIDDLQLQEDLEKIVTILPPEQVAAHYLETFSS